MAKLNMNIFDHHFAKRSLAKGLSIAEVDADGNCINACIDAKPFIFVFLFVIIIVAVILFVYAILVTIRVIEDLNVRSRVSHRGIVA